MKDIFINTLRMSRSMWLTRVELGWASWQASKHKNNYIDVVQVIYLACGFYQQVHQGSVSHGLVSHWNIPAGRWLLVSALSNLP